MANTPMMQQYEQARARCGDALLLFRMGDFYELFHEDAKTAARVLGLTLTSRDKGENPVPMAGFPHHQLDSYLSKLIAAGFRAAVCEQVEDPKQATGLVRREVTRVVTPGTLTDEALLDPRESNFLAALHLNPTTGQDPPVQAGLAWAELSTGRFQAAVLTEEQLADQLARIRPAELLCGQDQAQEQLPEGPWMLTTRPEWAFGHQAAQEALAKQFQVHDLVGFGFQASDALAIRAAGAVLDYLTETQQSSLGHFDRLLPYRVGQTLEIDQATRRSLEIDRSIQDGGRAGSLLDVMDRTVTAMGSRLLADWLANPLTEVEPIDERLDAVQELMAQTRFRQDARALLKGVYDLERLLARVTTGRATPRDLNFIGVTLSNLPPLKEQLAERTSGRLSQLASNLDTCPELCELLSRSLESPAPLSSREGGMIREGYHDPLDQLRALAAGGKQWIAQYQAQEGARSEIPNLKVGYNKVFGYYLEVTNAHREKVPDNYLRKQTLKNAERFITPELKEYEERVLSADQRAKDLEYDLFIQLRTQVQAAASRLQRTAAVISQLDTLASLAELAVQRTYCRPKLVSDPTLDVRDGRHPVLDFTEPVGTFVPNDALASPDEGMILLITGPNMAGKSTYIRQVALITLMAQVGSYVPAAAATIGVADRIFARVGASDDLAGGRSTFMVEMTETARILNTATSRSLVILDEIGRGTSTYDGISLAWAIIEHAHDFIGCRTLFATHYHELTDLEKTLKMVRNLNVAVKEWEDRVVFLHKIVAGAADKSYGIHVARLAGVPVEVNERAKQVLAQLEAEHLDPQGRPRIARGDKPRPRRDLQLTLFAPYEHPVLEKMRALDVNAITPLEALRQIQQWQLEIQSDPASPQTKRSK